MINPIVSIRVLLVLLLTIFPLAVLAEYPFNVRLGDYAMNNQDNNHADE